MTKLSDDNFFVKNNGDLCFMDKEGNTTNITQLQERLAAAAKVQQQCLDCARAHLSYFPDHFLIGDIEDYLLSSRPGTIKMGHVRPYNKDPEAYDEGVKGD